MNDVKPTQSVQEAAVTREAPIKAGDLLYAVGPAHNPPHGPDDMCIYSTRVKSIWLPGSFSAIQGGAMSAVELVKDRPALGFPKWIYHDYEIGHSVHRSAIEALRAFEEQAVSTRPIYASTSRQPGGT